LRQHGVAGPITISGMPVSMIIACRFRSACVSRVWLWCEQPLLHLCEDARQSLGVLLHALDDLLGVEHPPSEEQDEHRGERDGPLDADHGAWMAGPPAGARGAEAPGVRRPPR
jgi:hypothetical protein